MIIFFPNILNFFFTIYKDESRHQNCKNEHSEIKYLNNTWKNRVLKANNSPLELEKDFKLMNVSMDDMDKFEEK